MSNYEQETASAMSLANKLLNAIVIGVAFAIIGGIVWCAWMAFTWMVL